MKKAPLPGWRGRLRLGSGVEVAQRLGVLGGYAQEGLRSASGLPTALLPVLHRAQAYAEQIGEGVLRQADFGARFGSRGEFDLGGARGLAGLHLANGFEQVRLELLEFFIHR